MSTFHPFPLLPAELRAQIWSHTLIPRTVKINIKYKRHSTPPHRPYGPFLTSPTPIPALLQTCRASRNLGLYQKAFSDIISDTTFAKRYIWINFDMDILDIGELDIRTFTSIAPLVRRLRFTRDIKFSYTFREEEAHVLGRFVNVKEIEVVMWHDNEMRDWHGASEDFEWPCGVENVWVVDEGRGVRMGLGEVERWCDGEMEERYREEGVVVRVRNGRVLEG